MLTAETNFLALAACGVAAMVIGMVWYSPMLFGSAWMKATGLSKKDIDSSKSGMQKIYGMSFILYLVMAYVLNLVIRNLGGINTAIEGAQVGFWMWLGFIATTLLINSLYQFKKKNLFLIDSFYQLANLSVMGAMLAVWI